MSNWTLISKCSKIYVSLLFPYEIIIIIKITWKKGDRNNETHILNEPQYEIMDFIGMACMNNDNISIFVIKYTYLHISLRF